MNYYYLSSSLPTLSTEEAPSLTQDDFVGICEQHLTVADLQAVKELFAEPQPDSTSAFVREWHAAETQLRNSIVKRRASQHGVDADSFLQEHAEYNVYIEKAVEEAYSTKTPLERETSLDNFRWQQIEDLSGNNDFSNRSIFAYALKLKLALRWASMQEEAGIEKVDIIVKQESDTNENTTDDGGPQ